VNCLDETTIPVDMILYLSLYYLVNDLVHFPNPTSICLRNWCKALNSGGKFSSRCLSSAWGFSLFTSTKWIYSSFPACFDFINSCLFRSSSCWNSRYPGSFSSFPTKEEVTFIFLSKVINCSKFCSSISSLAAIDCVLLVDFMVYLFHTIIARSRKFPNKNKFAIDFKFKLGLC